MGRRIATDDVVYAWIGCHGMSDILLPADVWLPCYTASCVFAGIAPYAGAQTAVVAMTCLHFSHDATRQLLDAPVLLAYSMALGWLLSRRRERFAQHGILSYMACVHTPVHMWFHATSSSWSPMAVLFVLLLCSDLYQSTLRDIVERGAIEQDCWLNRGVLGVLGGHLLAQVWCRSTSGAL